MRLAETATASLAGRGRGGTEEPEGGTTADPLIDDGTYLSDHVVVTGYGPRARRILDAFELASVPYTIVSLDAQAGKESGRTVLSGDVSRHVIAERAGLRDARMVLAVDSLPAEVQQVARIAREHNPDVVVLAWAEDLAGAATLQHDGLVDHVVAEREAALDALINHALGHFEVPEAVMHTVLGSDDLIGEAGDTGTHAATAVSRDHSKDRQTH